MNRLTRIKARANQFLKADAYDECRAQIVCENRKTLKFLNISTALFSLFFCMLSYLNDTHHYLYKYIYTIFFLLSLGMVVLSKHVTSKKAEAVHWLIMLYYLLVFSYFVVVNIFYRPNNYITSYYILMILAFCFIMKPVRMIFLQLLMTIIMTVLIYHYKAASCIEIDIINAWLMMVVNIVFGCTALHYRMDDLVDLDEKEKSLNVITLYQGILDETQTAVFAFDTKTKEMLYANRVGKEHMDEESVKNLLESNPDEQEISLEDRTYATKRKKIGWYGREAYVEYLTDITASKQIEAQMLEAHESLQKKYQEELLYRAKAVSEDVLSTSRVNLTKGIVEEMRVGNVEGYEKEYHYTVGFVERIASFTKDVWITAEQNSRLSREGLLALYEAGETSITEEYVAELQDERHVWVKVDVNLLKRPETSDVMAFIYNRDITQERKLKHILECLMSFGYDEIYTVDTGDTRFAAVAIGQYALDQQEAKGWYEKELECLVNRAQFDSDKEKIRKELSLEGILQNLQEGPTHVVEATLISKNGKYRRKQIRCMYLNEETGIILITLTDIEDVVKQEKIKQEQLERALSMAKDASAAKSNFLASMSHEIRTPMNAIIGLNSIIRDNVGNGKQVVDCTEKLDSASKYLLSLLNDILDMSRIESGNMTLSHQLFDGDKFWDNVNILAKAQADPASIHYIFEREKAISRSYIGDATRMQQIMINLINNAIKFTPKDGMVKVSVREEEKLQNRAQITVSVADNGIGISQEFLPQVFEIFTQQHTGNTTAYKGSGLGLSIARNIARLMDGDITVESVEGEGTTFQVHIMIDVDKEKTTEETRNVSRRELDFTGKKVLLVEDHPLNTLVAKQLLSKKGFHVVHAENGQLALNLFKESKVGGFDVVLMDIRMPVMDGIEATKQIRALEREDAKSVPIIAMTANAYEEDRRITKEAGMNAHLAKPIEPEELFETLDQFINNF